MTGTVARLLALGAFLAAAWLVAPAISADPYLPGARDFEQRLPAVERVATAATRAAPSGAHAQEGPVTHRSPVIEAPARFDAAGLAGEMRPMELRGRERGGEWSKWTETTNGDPVWFGGAEELQLRVRGWRPAGTLHYVNVSGDSTPVEGALTDVRATVNGAVTAFAGLLGVDAASAAPTKPSWIPRRAWGANQSPGGCRPRATPSYGRVKAAAVHHTVSANKYSEAQAPGMVLAICRFHRNANGWNDIGYNALVDRFGNIYVGRAGGMARAVIGAQMQGYNAQTSGVSVLGTHTKTPVSRPAGRALVRLLAWKLVKHGHTTEGTARLVSAGGSANRYPYGTVVRTRRIVGHRRTGFTECPGDALAGQLPDLRARIQRRIENTGGGSSGGGVGG